MTIEQVSVVEEVHVPRDYQLEAKQAIWSAFDAGEAGALLVMATGLGKTLTAAWFTYEWLMLHPERVLFLVHTVDAAKQAKQKFEHSFGGEWTTGFMGDSVEENPDALVVFATFATMQNQLHYYPVEEFGLIIVDEAHHSQADTYRPVIEAFPNAFRFGMTATPDRLDKRDIRDLFGDPVYSYPLERALAEGKWLADVTYEVCHANIDLKVLRELIQRVHDGDRSVSRTQINRTLFLESEIEQVATQVLDHQDEETRTIVFCSSVDHANEVVDYFLDAETYHTGMSVYSNTESPLDRFRKGTTRTLIVVDKLNEAIDIPEADLVVFWRSTISKRIWLQQLGRGLRRTKDKKYVTVLDFVANCQRLMKLHEMGRTVQDILDELLTAEDRPEHLFIDLNQFQMSFTSELVDLLKVLERLNVDFLPFAEAKAVVQAAEPKVTTGRDYQVRYKEIHPRLPSNPNPTYSEDWVNWYDFLGTSKLSFTEAKAIVQAAEPKVTTGSDYQARYKDIHPRLPSNPHKVYAEDWVSWYDFIGTAAPVEFLSFIEAKVVVQAVVPKVTSTYDYNTRYRGIHPRLPSSLHQTYSEDWVSWYDFIGTAAPVEFLSFTEAKAIVQAVEPKVTTGSDYRTRYKDIHPRLPSNPNGAYSEDWVSWYDFLGKTRSSR